MEFRKLSSLPSIPEVSLDDLLLIQDMDRNVSAKMTIEQLLRSEVTSNLLVTSLAAGSNVSITNQSYPNLEDGCWEVAQEPENLYSIGKYNPDVMYNIGDVVYTEEEGDELVHRFWKLVKRIRTISSTAESGGLTPEQEEKFNSIATGATKVESSTTNGNIKINGVETSVFDISKITASMIKANVTWTDSYTINDKVSGSSYFHFKPLAFGMQSGDKLKSLTITASNTPGVLPDVDIYCKLIDPDDTSVAVARTGSYRLVGGESTELVFTEPVELNVNKTYRMVFCKFGTELTLVHTGLMIHLMDQDSDIYYSDNKRFRVILTAKYEGDTQRAIDLKSGGSISSQTLPIDVSVLKAMDGYTRDIEDVTFTDVTLLLRALVNQLG